MGKSADSYYPCTEKIRVVQDNLNTHTADSFYAASDSEKASDSAQRFEFHHTPIKVLSISKKPA
jgi:hypothetical protein